MYRLFYQVVTLFSSALLFTCACIVVKTKAQHTFTLPA
jgi:hypothetical protein